MPRGHQPILELHDITKAFGGVEALRGVDFALTAGEIHGLVGENGAGKSTLMKILSGAYQPDAGQMWLDAAPYRPRNPRPVPPPPGRTSSNSRSRAASCTAPRSPKCC